MVEIIKIDKTLLFQTLTRHLSFMTRVMIMHVLPTTFLNLLAEEQSRKFSCS